MTVAFPSYQVQIASGPNDQRGISWRPWYSAMDPFKFSMSDDDIVAWQLDRVANGYPLMVSHDEYRTFSNRGIWKSPVTSDVSKNAYRNFLTNNPALWGDWATYIPTYPAQVDFAKANPQVPYGAMVAWVGRMSDDQIAAWGQDRNQNGYTGLISIDEYHTFSNQQGGLWKQNVFVSIAPFNAFKKKYPSLTFVVGEHGAMAAIVKGIEGLMSKIPIFGQVFSVAFNTINAVQAQRQGQLPGPQPLPPPLPPSNPPLPPAPPPPPPPPPSQVPDYQPPPSQIVSVPSPTPVVTGAFRLEVEGRVVQDNVGTLQAISLITDQTTGIGDRFEIFESGQSLGLKIRTASGSIAIPPDQAAKVKSMSHADILKLLSNASTSASGASSGGGGSGYLLLLGIPVIAGLASKTRR